MQKQLNIPHVASMVFNTPLYATRQVVDSVKAVLTPKMQGQLTVNNLINTEMSGSGNSSELKAENTTYEPHTKCHLAVTNGIAVIKVHGILTTRRGHVTETCEELLSYEYLRNQIQAALDLEEVQVIVLDFNSGGGMATGCKEFADFVFQSRSVKPIYAIINFYAYSAAQFIAAACTETYISITGGCGSIGVIYEHMEISKWAEEVGLKVTAFYRGDHKNDLTEYEPVSESAAIEVNKRMDDAYSLFTSSVAEYRGMELQAVIDTQAKTFSGSEAVEIGLADHLMTPQEAINHIAQKVESVEPQQTQKSISLQAEAMQMQLST